MKNNEFVTNWVLDTVKKQYADDIALVVSHTTLRIDDSEKTISYFVPITERGVLFGRTFILDGEGFDIWGIDWNRLEKFADLTEYNITCLADSEILYSRTPEDAKKFENLKIQQANNLADCTKMRKNALEAYTEAKNIYGEMLFAKGSDVKLGAGYVLDYLAQSIAFSNLSYFKKSQTAQLEELKAMKNVPDDFPRLYQSVIVENNDENQKKLCYELICMVQIFLQEQELPAKSEKLQAKEHNFQDLSDWYAEGAYTWLRIRHYCSNNDVTKAYMWGVMLQDELNNVCSDFGIKKMELMEAYDSKHLQDFADHANKLEAEIRKIIKDGGGVIREFKNAEDFLNEV